MSAEDQSTTQDAPQPDIGPTEIILSRPDEPSADVIDVEAKEAAPEAKEAAPEAETSRDEKGRYKGGVQERIDELTKARRESEREAAYWKARANPDAGQAPAQKEPNQAPTQAQFNTQEEYIDALADFKVEQKLSQRENQSKQEQAVQQKASSWDTRLNSAREAIPDFDAVMNAAEMPVANHVAELLMEHDLGANLAHHLAKNSDVLDKLNAMSPAKAAFEIGRLATQFEKSATPPPDKKLTNAPPPARTVGQGRSTSPSLSEMSMEDYVKQRGSQGARWAR